jgi:energy-coupling factor transporter ATP-binding protein EcfA2
LRNITIWANDTSSESEEIYWLFGPAGSGKSTIAYTIARRFELTADVDDTIVLGGNFLCSRQFGETRYETAIVRTLVYHLALKCKAFADALCRSGKFESVYSDVRTQLEDLLVGPWRDSCSTLSNDSSSQRRYLVVIDALDEIEQQGGSTFLRDLLDVINQNSLPGLKFFVTSRPDPDLVKHVESFDRKQTFRLQDVEKEEVQADIEKYLEASLPNFKGRSGMKNLLEFAGGLFICAATIVRHLTPTRPKLQRAEQERFLRKLFPDTAAPQPPRLPSSAARLLDTLYLQILLDAFSDLEDEDFDTRIQILHTFLSTTEPVSASTAAKLVCDDSNETDTSFPFTEVADDVLSQLHAVLYTDADQRILSYHKSFSDFIFDQHRSNKYWCHSEVHHRRLTESCFRVMTGGLRFNIANIPTSFKLDSDNDELPSQVAQNIPPVLSYCSRNWSHHLSNTTSTTPDPLVNTLAGFLWLRALFWIEAMNLLDARGMCDPMLRAARIWVSKLPVSIRLSVL